MRRENDLVVCKGNNDATHNKQRLTVGERERGYCEEGSEKVCWCGRFGTGFRLLRQQIYSRIFGREGTNTSSKKVAI